MIFGSLIIGSLLGFFYGLVFALQQRRVFSLAHLGQKTIFTTFLFSGVRLTIFALSVFYVLHSPSINLILVILSFMVTAWYCILYN